jgi:predicted RNA-binding protein YlxR (DUF448 family)
MAAPVRTCIGCRRRAPVTELVRLRLEGGRIVIAAGSGRGASLHAAAACLERASSSGAFARAFKRPAAEIAVPERNQFLERLMAAALAPRPGNTENQQR